MKNIKERGIDVRIKSTDKNFKSLALHIGSVNEITEENLSLISFYLNPVKNDLIIDHVPGKSVLSIYKNDGKLLKTAALTQEINSVSLESLPNDLYLLILVTETGAVRSQKIVKID